MTTWPRRVRGNEWVGRAYANKTAFNKEFQELITRYAWSWPAALRRIKSAPVQRDEFRVHVRAAIKESGFNKVNIKEIILQQAICRGVPAANHAFKEAAEVIAEFTRSK